VGIHLKISHYKNSKTVEPTENTDITAFLDSVRLGVWKSQVEEIRAEKDEDRQKAMKMRIPCVTISGTFSTRKEANLLEHSGFIAMDFDNIEVINGVVQTYGIEKDQYTYALADSVRGGGFFVIVKINPSKHKESFLYLREYYFKNYGLEIDDMPSNPASLRYVSYDKGLFINEKSKTALYKVAKYVKPKSLPLIVSENELDQLISNCVQSGVNICETYEDWRNVGFALADRLEEGGRSLFHALSNISTKYKPNVVDRQYTACLKAGKDGITINTLYWMMQQNGVELPKQKKIEIAFSRSRLNSGASKKDVAVELVELHGATDAEARDIIEASETIEKVDYSELATDVRSIVDLFPIWLQDNYLINRNEITGHYMYNGENLNTAITNKIITHAKRDFNNGKLSTTLINELLLTTDIKVINPLKIAIESSVPYTDELERLCATIETTSPLGPIFIRKWMLGLWAQPYYAQSKLIKGKDDDILMTEKWVILDDEGGGKSKKDAQNFKELTSMDVFNLRKPYDKENGSYKRLSVLCVTTNETQIINDPTGNTRILPIEVIDINRQLYNDIDRDALFSQLYDLYKKGEQWQLTSDEKKALQSEFDLFETDKPERDLLLTYFKEPEVGESFTPRTSSEIKTYIEQESGFKFRSDRVFFAELNRLFKGNKKSTARGTKRLYCYQLAEIKTTKDYKWTT